MPIKEKMIRTFFAVCVTFLTVTFLPLLSAGASVKGMSDAQISREILKENNRAIIEEFLKAELREVNEQVTKGLLPKYPSLKFFLKQVDKGPMKSLIFLEEQVHKLRDAQKNIDSLPFSLAFRGDERQKILNLKPTADKIVSYGIPLMKRDFMRVVFAAKEVADKKNKHPIELMKDQSFRDAVYRQVEPTAQGLDTEMGKLSEGELICMNLGFVLEQVTVTNLWLSVTDNKLPDQQEYMVYRTKRSEYFQKKLKRIYGEQSGQKR